MYTKDIGYNKQDI